eukprot:384755_1
MDTYLSGKFYSTDVTCFICMKRCMSQPFYNMTSRSRDEIRAVVLSEFFQCNFEEEINFSHAFRHASLIKEINHLKDLDASSLQQKCLSSKAIIFKFILFIRNPMTHIPSKGRMVKQDWSLLTDAICSKQLAEMINFIRLEKLFMVCQNEDFFRNITYNFPATIIEYNTQLGLPIMNTTLAYIRYQAMKNYIQDGSRQLRVQNSPKPLHCYRLNDLHRCG